MLNQKSNIEWFANQSNIEIFNDCARTNGLGDALELQFDEAKPLPGAEMGQLNHLYAFSCYKQEGKIYFDHSFFKIYGIGSASKKILAEQGLDGDSNMPFYNCSYRANNAAYLLLDESNGELKWIVYESCTKFKECMLALKDTDDMSKLETNYVNFWTPTFYTKLLDRSLDDFMYYLFKLHDLRVEDFGEYEQVFKDFTPYTTAHTFNSLLTKY